MFNRQSVAIALFALTGLLPGSASAQNWPTQAVTIVVPYAPGGGLDILARALGEKLSQRWKQPVLVENKAGAAEIIAASSVIRAKPDGYTLFFATDVGLETNPFLFSKLPYNPRTDFTPITRVIEGPAIYVVRADSPTRTIGQLLRQAKENPGKVAYGSSGTGGAVHLIVNWLSVVSDTPFTHVPYKGLAPAVADILAGVVHFSATPLSMVAPFIKEDRLRAIATTGEIRTPALPDVPTLAELGYKDSVIKFMFGLVGPARLPSSVAEKIASDVAAVTREPEFLAKNIDVHGYVLAVETPASFAQYLETNAEKQRARVKAANVRLD